MKDLSGWNLPLTITFCLAAMTAPVLAADNANKQQPRPVVRVTTGIEAVQGWETGLVRANPNLARWHWDPIYSYKQGLARVVPDPVSISNRQGTNKITGKVGPAAYQYKVPAPQDNRPNHIPFSSKALEEVQARYSQASPPSVPEAKPKVESNVSAQLSHKQTAATILPNEIATYGRPYSTQEKLGTNLKYSYGKSDVYGQLLSERRQKSVSQKKYVKHKGPN